MLVVLFAGTDMRDAHAREHPPTCGGTEIAAEKLSASKVTKSKSARALQQEVFNRNSRRRFAVLDVVHRMEEQQFT